MLYCSWPTTSLKSKLTIAVFLGFPKFSQKLNIGTPLKDCSKMSCKTHEIMRNTYVSWDEKHTSVWKNPNKNISIDPRYFHCVFKMHMTSAYENKSFAISWIINSWRINNSSKSFFKSVEIYDFCKLIFWSDFNVFLASIFLNANMHAIILYLVSLKNT